jgi:septal ring factor EnvC (AmiA/AmiB activator)
MPEPTRGVPDEDITARLRAVERALTDGDTHVEDLSDSAAVHERLDDLAADVATLTERLDALDATVQSLHGYVGELEHVNDRVVRRADAARAAVERLDDDRLAAGGQTAPDAEATSGRDSQSATTKNEPGDRHREPGHGDSVAADTHSLLDAAEDAPPDSGSDSADEESLLERVRESL